MQHESDTDLYIRSLSESLMIHKEIVERIENEKEQYVEKMDREYKEERSKTQHQYQVARQALDEQLLEYQKLQMTNHRLASDLENTKQEYKRMEANYYSHVRQIKATDDDLSTVQSEMTSLFSQVNQLCMSLRSKVDREAGTAFAKERWPDKEDVIKSLLKEDEELLDSGYIGLFTEKYIVEVILDILEKPLNPGVSINDAFEQVEAWFAKRNPEWAVRLRQQASALVAKQPADEEETIENVKQQIVRDVMETLTKVHPKASENPNQEKKIANIINRAAKLSLAIKGQDVPVQVQPIEEGSATFDEEYMKPASRGKSEGTVLLVITPSFIAHDQQDDDEHGMVIPAKVLCI
ncbi:hypothetical protein BJV82DRAFT_519308 [Fennellomyces sp. T-0311]|nr:hypothetical protein BJV82DRAFT_519308 [Fennellomyces sp. T-0311]